MTCYHPQTVYRSKALTVNGKRTLVWNKKDSNGDTLQISCGQCIGCRLEKSRVWACRISNEASLYDENCFITLTYSPENLPENGSLVPRDFTLFLKRLRKKYGPQIRFYQCGEYGENFGRPHYHACLLNFDFPDKYLWRKTQRGDLIYRSPSLEKLWGLGNCEIGQVTFESAAYCARYITKKVTGKNAESHYNSVDLETGEIITKIPEYTNMSRKPGIGAPWLQKFSKDVFNHDVLVIRGGTKVPPPRYYNNRYEMEAPEHYAKIKAKRLEKQLTQLTNGEFTRKERDNTYERRKVKEIVHQATINQSLNRTYEKE